MKLFSFRWDRMLRLTGSFEKESRNALATAIADVNSAEDRLGIFSTRLHELQGKRHNLITEGSEITKIQEVYQGEVEIGLRVDHQVSIIGQLEKIVETRRAELTERMRERKTYGKLRERALERHEIEMKRDETRIVDEVASIAHTRGVPDENV